MVGEPELKAAIRVAVARMATADEGDDDALAADIAFHLSVLHASGNRFFAQLGGVTETALRFSIRMTNRVKGVRRASVPDHKKISDAILAGDPETAETAMRALIQEVLDLIEKADGDEHRAKTVKTRASR